MSKNVVEVEEMDYKLIAFCTTRIWTEKEMISLLRSGRIKHF